MEPESFSRRQSPLSTPSAPLGSALASGESTLNDNAGESQDEPAPGVLSRLSFCVAWLFGLEAFLTDSGAHPGRPRA